ncbi:hypothetical protein VITFI_CDS1347 [Vitreoscilla filiformis]|uniref:Uncharacterized protein n=1 Tax=Vitreoscilla filiformis TaxID=63 RepID=A0A221KDS2_VITFI|nr:hypothetical protein VITFI_CDS1347 [Vitreoscilla filiformis]
MRASLACSLFDESQAAAERKFQVGGGFAPAQMRDAGGALQSDT